MRSTADRARYQTCVLEHPHMFRGARETHAERRRQFPDREFAFGQVTKHGPPRWIREGMKNSIEMGELFNHMVQHNRRGSIVNRLV
jgi:hypothetical protein